MDILDSNWISNILSISFTLVVFFVGVPLLIIQTYVPENLRKYYFQLEIYRDQFREVRYVLFFLLLVILIFGNQGVVHFIDTHFCPLGETCDNRYFVKEIYYFITLASFIFLCIWTYRFFISKLESSKEIKKQIISDIFNSLHSDEINDKNTIFKNLSYRYSDIIDLYTIYTSRIDRRIFFTSFYELLDYLILDSKYSGKELNLLFKDICYDNFVIQFMFRSSLEVKEFLIAINRMADNCYKNPNKRAHDFNYLANNLLPALALKIIANDDMSCFRKVLHVMRKFGSKQVHFVNIYWEAFTKKHFYIIMQEIQYLIRYKDTSRTNQNLIESDMFAIKKSLFVYLSLINSANRIGKNKAYEIINIHNDLLSVIDLKLIIDDYIRESRYEIALLLTNLKEDWNEIAN